MLDDKALTWVQIIGGLAAGWFAWQATRYDTLILALVVLLMGFSAHHNSGGKKRRR
jgi:hypothetical protein